MTFDEREEFMDARLLNLRLQAERRTVQPDHDLMLWAHDEIERMQVILAAIHRLVHIPTPGHMKAYTHFQRDFDQIRAMTKPFAVVTFEDAK